MKRHKGIEDFILKNVQNHPNDLVAFTLQKFDRTRQTIHWHVSRLVNEGKICRVGRTKGASYYLNKKNSIKIHEAVTPSLDESSVWSKQVAPSLTHLPQNVQYICQFGLTEMINNAKDHSGASGVTIDFALKYGRVHFEIYDDGVGIFEKIKTHFGLSSISEAILHLSKGKVTTDPENHTGQGIFFTSRMFEEFSILSGNMYFKRFANGEDWLLEEASQNDRKGTTVCMQIPWNSARTAQEVFAAFTDPDAEDGPSFDKTKISVILSKQKEEVYISRTQARRIVLGLEKFTEITLNFQNVVSVGQGFVDEVFRVFKNQNPHVKLKWTNASEAVEFMIKRTGPNQLAD